MACATPLDPDANLRQWRAFEKLEEQITELWGHLNAATYRFLMLVAEFDREKAYERHGLVNTAQWLNWQCGIGPLAAREKVRVARALEQLPEISDAFAKGEFSYSKVRAMTRVATAANESVLVHVARYGTASHVEKLVRKYRWTQRRDAGKLEQLQHAQRHVNYFFDVNGELILNARLPPVPANTMSRGSSPTSSVRTTRGGDVAFVVEPGPRILVERIDIELERLPFVKKVVSVADYVKRVNRELNGGAPDVGPWTKTADRILVIPIVRRN